MIREIRGDRLAVLRKIADGERPEVQRIRLKWLETNGWLKSSGAGTSPGYRLVTLTADAWKALRIHGITADTRKLFLIRLQLGGYRSDKTMKAGRK